MKARPNAWEAYSSRYAAPEQRKDAPSDDRRAKAAKRNEPKSQ